MTYLRKQKTPEGIRIGVTGNWIIANAADLEAELDALHVEGDVSVSFQPEELTQLDLTGAWLLYRKVKVLQGQDKQARLSGFDSSHFHFLDELPSQEEAEPASRFQDYQAILAAIGRVAIQEKTQLRTMMAFFGRTSIAMGRALLHPHRLRFTDITHHIYVTGLHAVPIVTLIAFLISIVLAYQGAYQLAKFGANIYTVDLVAISLLREMGVLLTAIMVAGRSGSAFAAQIGFMKINEEVAALSTMGFDPYEILVIPRILALTIALPLLTVLADLMGLAGAALLSVYMLDLSLTQFFQRTIDSIGMNTFMVGIIKAPFFGFIVGFIGTMRGMQVSGSAESVGQQTTNAVVQSIFIVILVDAVFSILFSWLDY